MEAVRFARCRINLCKRQGIFFIVNGFFAKASKNPLRLPFASGVVAAGRQVPISVNPLIGQRGEVLFGTVQRL